jgi:hypothetical protein
MAIHLRFSRANGEEDKSQSKELKTISDRQMLKNNLNAKS